MESEQQPANPLVEEDEDLEEIQDDEVLSTRDFFLAHFKSMPHLKHPKGQKYLAHISVKHHFDEDHEHSSDQSHSAPLNGLGSSAIPMKQIASKDSYGLTSSPSTGLLMQNGAEGVVSGHNSEVASTNNLGELHHGEQHHGEEHHGKFYQLVEREMTQSKLMVQNFVSKAKYEIMAAEKSRIPFAKSHFLRRHAPYKDMIVPSGPHASLWDALLNTTKSILGAGLLSLPLSYAWSGYILMTIILVFLLFLNAFTGDLIIKCCSHLKLTSYNELAEHTFGKKFAIFVEILTIICGFGSLAAYEVLIGDFACGIISYITGSCNRVIVVYVFSMVTVFPLSLLQSLNSLRFLSFLTLTFIAAFGVVVIYLSGSFLAFNPMPSTVVPFNWSPSIFQAICVGCFAYACHLNVVPIFVELKRPNALNGYRFIDWAMAISSIIYISIGLFGYLQFGSETQGNILDNYPKTDLVIIMIAAMLVVVVVSYPLANFPIKISIDYMLFSHEYHNPAKANRNHQNHRMWIYSSLLFLAAASMGAFLDDVGAIFSITGATTTVLLTIIIPPSIYLKLRFKKLIPPDHDPKNHLMLLIFSIGAIILGCIVGIMGFLVNVLGFAGITF